ncbi:MAG: hypothetical protein CMF76_05065 [Maricaulis sp.]|nr:hypothetical protein [Oceanicaulis sp.]MAZ91321.1 hypothetical protein [Maricaulis sp.]|tara:strand:+ start:99 stop:1241 length:1143 start_codon:yes stop_codon:yes gene_type:complete
MQLKLAALAAVACLWLVAEGASAQDLPSSVTGPYVEYQRALETGDEAAAYDAARRAFEAGEAERIDRETLGLLAENFGAAAAALGNFERAYEIWRDAARLGERAGIEPADQAWREFNTARAAYRSGQTRDARRFADDALENLELAREAGGTYPAFVGDLAVLGAQLSAEAGRWAKARNRAGAALLVFAQSGREPDGLYAQAYYIAAIARFVVERDKDAALYHSMMAEFILSSLPDEGPALALARSVRTIAADDTEEQRLAVAERLRADPLYQARYARWEEPPEASEADGYVDVVLLERHEPEFPYRAANRGLQGIVSVSFDIDEGGRVVDPRVVEGMPTGAFDQAGLAAMRGWRFEPALQDGEPVYREDYVTSFVFWLSN